MKFGVMVGGPTRTASVSSSSTSKPKERTLADLMSGSDGGDDGPEVIEETDGGDEGDVSERYMKKLAAKTGVDDPDALVELIKAVVESC